MSYRPGAVAQQVADGDALLAGLCELGPVLGDRVVVVEQAAVRQHVQRRRRDALGGRERHGERVLFPRVTGRVARAAPDVHDLLAAVIDAHRAAPPPRRSCFASRRATGQ
jgi:hypothetical protein